MCVRSNKKLVIDIRCDINVVVEMITRLGGLLSGARRPTPHCWLYEHAN